VTSSSTPMSLVAVSSAEQYADIVASNGNVVVEFTATWCGACKRVAPAVRGGYCVAKGRAWLSGGSANAASPCFLVSVLAAVVQVALMASRLAGIVVFAVVDVGELEDLAAAEGVSRLPMFRSFVDGAQVLALFGRQHATCPVAVPALLASRF
jgi:thiol-disulfide isomerase/thioredoxin